VPATGWTPRFVTLCAEMKLVAACAALSQGHSYGEYVFDWAWANAYEQHGLATTPRRWWPCRSPRCPARGCWPRRRRRARPLLALACLVPSAQSCRPCTCCLHETKMLPPANRAGLMLRHTVQFHWTNAGYADFDAFLASLSQDKRKKIRQERRKVAEAGVTFRWARADHHPADWDFFYRCYERTYLEHGNAPYLTRDFFQRMAATHAASTG
jgi:predicted N-acyltransferase